MRAALHLPDGTLLERFTASNDADEPAFVHPDVGFLSRVLSGKAAYLRHGSARAFSVEGRAFAVGFVDPRVQHKHGRALGSIGFFEATSRAAAIDVLASACEWLASRGVTETWAPLNGNPLFGGGLREDRFDGPPFVGCAHQPPAYREYVEATRDYWVARAELEKAMGGSLNGKLISLQSEGKESPNKP